MLDGGANTAAGDTASYAERSTDVTVSVTAGGEDTPFSGIENLTGGGGDDTLIGDTAANTLSGGAGDDLLRPDAGGGANIGGANGTPGGANGSAGDIVSYQDVSVEVMADISSASGTATGTGLSQTIASVENLTGGPADDTLIGDSGANLLSGGAGDDLLRPASGGGTNTGGTHGTAGGANGSDGDTVSYQDVSANVSADLTAGTATASGGLSQGLVEVENLTGGSGDDQLSGDGAVNRLAGGTGNDTLEGRGGVDVLDGGANTAAGDTASYAERSTDVTVSVTAGGEDTPFSGIENLTGGGGDDTLIGDTAANTLSGGAGDDLLRPNAGGGANIGGANGTPGGANGSTGDIVSYQDVSVEVVADISSASGTATGTGLSQTIASVENLTGGPADDTLIGDSGANLLSGGAGDDLLRPASGGGTNTGGTHGTAGGANGNSGDIVSYQDVSVSVTADLGAGTATAAGGLSQTIATTENLTGGERRRPADRRCPRQPARRRRGRRPPARRGRRGRAHRRRPGPDGDTSGYDDDAPPTSSHPSTPVGRTATRSTRSRT